MCLKYFRNTQKNIKGLLRDIYPLPVTRATVERLKNFKLKSSLKDDIIEQNLFN